MSSTESETRVQDITLSIPKLKGKPMTYRVQGIPSRFTKQSLEDTVKHALHLEDSITAKVKSLADDPSRQGKKIATIDASQAPGALSSKSGETEWSILIGEDEYILFDVHFQGWTPLHSTVDSSCTTDLIAISGLASHAFGSFKARNKSFMWLRDALPNEFPQMRILIYGYDTKLEASTSTQNLDDLAKTLQWQLKSIRSYAQQKKRGESVVDPERPLIFIGHSLGGIVIKAALNRMSDSYTYHRVSEDSQSDQANFKSARGMLFFGVPNNGMPIDQWIPLVGDQSNRFFIEQLSKPSDILKVHREKFRQVFTFEDSKIYSFYETELSPTAIQQEDGKWVLEGRRIELVDRASAIHGRAEEGNGNCTHPINKTHSDLVKFTSEYDGDYMRVLSCLLDIVPDACSIIEKRFLSLQDRLRSLIDSITLGQFLAILETTTANQRSLPKLQSPDRQPDSPWVFENLDYKRWENSINHSHGHLDNHPQILWLSGSTHGNLLEISSYIINRAVQKTDTCVLYSLYTCHGKTGKWAEILFFRTLLYQALHHIPEHKRGSVVRDILSSIIRGVQQTKSEQQLYQYLEEDTTEKAVEKILDDAVDECQAALSMILAGMDGREILIIVDDLVSNDVTDNNFLGKSGRFVNFLGQPDPRIKVLLTSNGKTTLTRMFREAFYIEHDQERQECLSSLHFNNTRFQKISKEHDGTFEWFWASTECKKWSTTKTSSVLLAIGKPGSGKSTLTKYFNDHLKEREPGLESAIVARYFYSAREGELQSSHYSMLRSILHDILSQDESFFYSGFQDEYRMELQGRSHISHDYWLYDRLKRLLLLLRDHKPEKPIYLIIDAVDEANEDDRRNILHLIFRICSEAKNCILKVFIASRPLGALEDLSRKYRDIANVLTLQDHTQTDIRHFTRSFMEELEPNGSLEEETEYIVENAQGVFIWVELVRRQLLKYQEQARPRRDIFAFLKSLPRELKSMYEHMLRQLHGEDEGIVKRSATIFIFVLCAGRPLTLDELIHAVCISDDPNSAFESPDTHLGDITQAKRFYVTVCGGNFIEYNEDTTTVQVIHQTVREFFLDGGLSKIGPWTCIEDAHSAVLIACLQYLELWTRDMSKILPGIPKRNLWAFLNPWAKKAVWSFKHSERCAKYLDKRPLVCYALNNIEYHSECSHRGTSELVVGSNFINSFTPAAYLLDSWANSSTNLKFSTISHKDDAYKLRNSVLASAIRMGLFTATEVLLAMKADVNAKTPGGKTPLILAAMHGHELLARLLIALPGIRANARDGDNCTALIWAAKNGHEGIVELLLDEPGIDLDQKDVDGRTAKSWAKENKHPGIVKLIENAMNQDYRLRRCTRKHGRYHYEASQLNKYIQNQRTMARRSMGSVGSHHYHPSADELGFGLRRRGNYSSIFGGGRYQKVGPLERDWLLALAEAWCDKVLEDDGDDPPPVEIEELLKDARNPFSNTHDIQMDP